MKRSICLHGLKVKGLEELRDYLLCFLQGDEVRSRIKEERFPNNDMYKYRQLSFRPKEGAGITVSCMWGVLLSCDRMAPVSDIKISFDAENTSQAIAAEHLVKKLLGGRIKFILTEPDVAGRISYLRGVYGREMAPAAQGSAASALYGQLSRQLYVTSLLWQQLFAKGAEMGTWRQVRVKLRSLRSFVALLKPLLPQVTTIIWQGVLKKRADALSSVREYDAAIVSCGCIKPDSEGVKRRVPQLLLALRQRREQEARTVLKNLDLNELTLELAEMLLGVYSVPPAVAATDLGDFYRLRFKAWSTGILAKAEANPGFQDMEKLHELRIKLKRFRFALLCAEELNVSNKFLRGLKCLVDNLGRLHDCYTEGELLTSLVAARPEDEELREEAAIFLKAEADKANAARRQLPCEWEHFSMLLADWLA